MKAMLRLVVAVLLIVGVLALEHQQVIDLSPTVTAGLGMALLTAIGAIETGKIIAAGKIVEAVETNSPPIDGPTAMRSADFDKVVKRAGGN